MAVVKLQCGWGCRLGRASATTAAGRGRAGIAGRTSTEHKLSDITPGDVKPRQGSGLRTPVQPSCRVNLSGLGPGQGDLAVKRGHGRMGPGSGHLHPSPAGQAHTGAASRWGCGAAPGHDEPPLHSAAPPCHRPGILIAQLPTEYCLHCAVLGLVMCLGGKEALQEITIWSCWSCSMGQVMTAQPTVLSSICQVVDSDHNCAACGQSLGEVYPPAH